MIARHGAWVGAVEGPEELCQLSGLFDHRSREQDLPAVRAVGHAVLFSAQERRGGRQCDS